MTRRRIKIPRVGRSEEKVVALFKEVVQQTGENKIQMHIDEMAERTDLSVTTVYRAINSLEQRGIIRTLPVESRQEPSIIVWLGDEKQDFAEARTLGQDFEKALRNLEVVSAQILSVFNRLVEERDSARLENIELKKELEDSRKKLELLDRLMAMANKEG